MKTNLVIAMAVSLVSSVSFANGVEKILPKDAKNVQIKSAELVYMPVCTAADDAAYANSNNIEGYPETCTGTATALEVTFVYQSKSTEDVPVSGSGLDGQITDSDDTRPQFSLDLNVSSALAAQIKGHQLNARDAVAFSVATQAAQVQEPVAYHCQYVSTNDNGDFVKVDPSCQEPSGIVTENRPVLTLNLK